MLDSTRECDFIVYGKIYIFYRWDFVEQPSILKRSVKTMFYKPVQVHSLSVSTLSKKMNSKFDL